MSDAQRTYYGPDWLPAGGQPHEAIVAYDKPVGTRVRAQLDYLCGKPAEWLPPGSCVVMHPDGRSEVVQPRGVVSRYAIREYEAVQKLGDEQPPTVDDKA